MTDQTPTAAACPAALNIAGEHFACDWQPVDQDGDHKGWAHTNATAQAQWTSDPLYDQLAGLTNDPATEEKVVWEMVTQTCTACRPAQPEPQTATEVIAGLATDVQTIREGVRIELERLTKDIRRSVERALAQIVREATRPAASGRRER